MDIFIGSIDAEPEAPVIWPADAKNQLIGKDPDAGKDWSQEQMGTTEDEIVGWYQWLDEHEFEQTPENGEGPGKPGVLQSTGSQRVRHDWVTKQQHYGPLSVKRYFYFLICCLG